MQNEYDMTDLNRDTPPTPSRSDQSNDEKAPPEHNIKSVETPHTSPHLSTDSPRRYNAYPRSPYKEETQSDEKKTKSVLGPAIIISLLVLILVFTASIIYSAYNELSDIDFSLPKLIPGEKNPEPDTKPDSDAPSLEEYFDSISKPEIKIPRAKNGTGQTVTLVKQPDTDPLSLQEIYKKCSASVVGIKVSASNIQGGYGWGTGIILSSDGYIITNTHVLEGASEALVVLESGKEHPAKLVGYDSATDVAVIKIDVKNLTPAEFGDSNELQVGDDCVAIGNPLGDELRGTMTNGIISAINRDISYQGYNMTLLQTNTAINEGNSGGPLINSFGQVIGITNMKMSSYYYRTTIEGIGFAIPSQVVKTIADELIETGKVKGRPGIGITIGIMPDEYVGDDYPEGLYVADIIKSSDAYKKGIRIGDILVMVNGEQVYSSEDVARIREGFEIGETLKFKLFRDGEYFEVDVKLMDMSDLY
ncbi:S1C family serine protease [Clostridiaceae bacterium OttesenSCG-928-D20]|nr:S1C family serine protease [Clostridiaceae bacterium OttesenSCG-928-D20]